MEELATRSQGWSAGATLRLGAGCTPRRQLLGARSRTRQRRCKLGQAHAPHLCSRACAHHPHSQPVPPTSPATSPQIGLPNQELFRLPRVGMWTKVRPGARALLAAAAPRYELWIHTAGSRSYALAVAELLGAHYFGPRILAQPDGGDDAAAVGCSRA